MSSRKKSKAAQKADQKNSIDDFFEAAIPPPNSESTVLFSSHGRNTRSSNPAMVLPDPLLASDRKNTQQFRSARGKGSIVERTLKIVDRDLMSLEEFVTGTDHAIDLHVSSLANQVEVLTASVASSVATSIFN